MKIIKIEKFDSKVSRKLVSNFGKSIYSYPEVKSVFIKIKFKDGSSIGFSKDEDEDSFDEFLKEPDKNNDHNSI